jgi:uncharacterized protein YerC
MIQNIENEEWKAVADYEGLYEVSNMGRVKSCLRYTRARHGLRRVPEKIMKITTHPQTGYERVQLSKDRKLKTIMVHALVMGVFGPEKPTNGKIIHKDGNKINNCIDNLIWGTASRHGNRGQGHANAKMNDIDVEQIKLMSESMTYAEIAKMTGISKGQISKITNLKSRRNI